jgi:hypothetical protein
VFSAFSVQRFSSHGDVAAGAVLDSTAAIVLLCPLLNWLADAYRS